MRFMSDFSKINYRNALALFEKEEREGRRLRMGDLRTSLWLKENNINFSEVKKISVKLPDPRLVIIGEGKLSGFYIYSHMQRKCFKSIHTKQKIVLEEKI
jgi:hypothetical protein